MSDGVVCFHSFTGSDEDVNRWRQLAENNSIQHVEFLTQNMDFMQEVVEEAFENGSFRHVSMDGGNCSRITNWGKIVRLDLRFVRISPASAAALGCCPLLEEFALVSSSLHEEVAAALGGQFQCHHFANLKKLDLTETKFVGTAVTELAQGLAFNTSLENVCLSECNLMDEQMAEIVRALPFTVQELDISFNKCRSAGMMALVEMLISQGRGRNNSDKNSKQSIKRLTMGFQAFGEAKRMCNLSSFCEALANNASLEELDLSGNSLRDDDMTMIAHALCKNHTLRVLDLAENRFTNLGISILAQQIQMDHLSLQHLILEGNRFDQAGLQLLTEAMDSNTRLQEIEVDEDLKKTTQSNESCWSQLAYHLDIKWGGGRLLQQQQCNNNVPLGLWTLIFSRANEPEQFRMETRNPVAADIVYCLLREGPVLLSQR